MNLRPASTHESVSILLIPFEQYSTFPKAVDTLIANTRYPFELIVVEGNAPDAVRHELEKRKKRRRNMKIIYSDHRPRMAEAFNLGLAHIRTRYAFLMHNNLFAAPGWLSNLLERAKDRPGVFCPVIHQAGARTVLNGDSAEADLHGFLVTKEILNAIGPFDETVSAPLVGVDLGCHLNAKGIPMLWDRHPGTLLEYRASGTLKGADLALFKHQWDEPHLRRALAYLNQKWGLALDEHKYLKRLEKKKAVNAPEIGFKKLLRLLSRV